MPSPTLEPPVEEVVVADIPKETWEPIFHESIDERTKITKIGRLRDFSLRNDDIEVRVWGGFGLTPLEGFLISRRNDKWTAFRLDQHVENNKHWTYRTIKLEEPRNGWQQTWAGLLRQGLLTLPDARSIDCEAMVLDGYSFVVEVKKGPAYRTYMYDNPDELPKDRCTEAGKILTIAKIIDEQFEIAQHRSGK